MEIPNIQLRGLVQVRFQDTFEITGCFKSKRKNLGPSRCVDIHVPTLESFRKAFMSLILGQGGERNLLSGQIVRQEGKSEALSP